MTEHLLPESLRERRPIRILVIGAGGSGSQIFLGLPYLNQALRAWGHRDGLEVTLIDGDNVSETNCVRQPFSVSDIGLNKAFVLVNRVNLFWGLEWKSVPHAFSRTGNNFNNYACDIVFGCVDTRAARREIHKAVTGPYCRVGYWLDLGNNAASGQYLLGQPSNGPEPEERNATPHHQRTLPRDHRRGGRRRPTAELLRPRSSGTAGTLHQSSARGGFARDVGKAAPLWTSDPSRSILQCGHSTDVSSSG